MSEDRRAALVVVTRDDDVRTTTAAELDRRYGRDYTVLACAAPEDVGRALNPAGIQDQVHGGVAQGIGWALYEQMAYDQDGRLQTGTLMDYTLPNAMQVPPITSITFV